jgi:hypothetical protein
MSKGLQVPGGSLARIWDRGESMAEIGVVLILKEYSLKPG